MSVQVCRLAQHKCVLVSLSVQVCRLVQQEHIPVSLCECAGELCVSEHAQVPWGVMRVGLWKGGRVERS